MNTRVSPRQTTAPRGVRAPMDEVASIILPAHWRGRLEQAPSLSALSIRHPDALAGLRPVVVDASGRAPGSPGAAGKTGQAVVGEALFDRLRAHVRNDPAAVNYTPCIFQECDHLELVQRTWDLRLGGVYALLSGFVLAGKSPTAETLALLCERYGEPVFAWSGGDEGVEFVRLFHDPRAKPRAKEPVH